MADLRAISVLRDLVEAQGGLVEALEVPELRSVFDELWRVGEAWRLILDPKQAAWVDRFEAGESSQVWGHGRQRGKSFGAQALLDAYARRWPGARVRYCALTIDTAKAILSNAAADFYASCPEELRPKPDPKSDDWLFPNGSRLIIMGTDAQTFRRGRGFSRVGRQVLDECGFYQDLGAVERALNPGMMVPGPSGESGRTLYASTPSESPAHDFAATVRVHKGRGAYFCETFFDNPRVNPESIIRAECERTGLLREELFESTAFRREYLGEWVAEETRAAVPAWTDEVMKTQIVALERPAFFDGYSSLDIGYSPDPSFVTLGWHDPSRNALVIEYEFEHHRGTVASLAEGMKALETEAWGASKYEGTLKGLEDMIAELPEFLQRKVHKDAPRQPYMRVGDNDLLVLSELAVVHGLAVFPSRKDDKALAVDFLGQIVAARRLFVHPRCVRTIEQLSSTIWNKARTQWERTSKDHGEAIDNLVYLARNVRWHRDCRPKAPVIPWGNAPAANATGWDAAFRRTK